MNSNLKLQYLIDKYGLTLEGWGSNPVYVKYFKDSNSKEANDLFKKLEKDLINIGERISVLFTELGI